MFLYDRLLHLPLLGSAPGTIGSGTKTDALALSADPFPTLAELTAARVPEGTSGSRSPVFCFKVIRGANGSSPRPPTAISLRTCPRSTSLRWTGMRLRATLACCGRRCGQCTEPRWCVHRNGNSSSTRRSRRDCIGSRKSAPGNGETQPGVPATRERAGTSKSTSLLGGTGNLLRGQPFRRPPARGWIPEVPQRATPVSRSAVSKL